MKKHTSISLRSCLSLGLAMPLLLALLSACSVPRINVSADAVLYIPEVVQGNFVSREQKDALKPGMSRLQVREVLGTPLVSSVFHEDRWDYVFTIRRQGAEPQQRRFSVFFKNNVLERVEGDALPTEAEFAAQLDSRRPPTKLPALEATETDLAKFPAKSTSAVNASPSAAPMPPVAYPPLEPAR